MRCWAFDWVYCLAEWKADKKAALSDVALDKSKEHDKVGQMVVYWVQQLADLKVAWLVVMMVDS